MATTVLTYTVLVIILHGSLIRNSTTEDKQWKQSTIINSPICSPNKDCITNRITTIQCTITPFHTKHIRASTLAYLAMILITISNDVNMNPRPSQSESNYPCGTCDKPVNWDGRGIVCDTCNQWYHVSCQSMSPSLYLEHVNDSAVAWDCIACNCPNYSTFCFSMVFSTSNHFSILSESPLESPKPTNQMQPIHASTPTKSSYKTTKSKQHLRILNVNFQSIKTKQPQLENLIDSTKPDIIFGIETWINHSIKDSQIFPKGYNIFRNDRNLSGGGVLIAVKNIYITTSVPELQTDCEIVWCKLELVGYRAIYLSSYYNPRTSNEERYSLFVSMIYHYGDKMKSLDYSPMYGSDDVFCSTLSEVYHGCYFWLI
ncbi:unnamed protein product [Mytilus coruscus]|uniref:PHD-type domain-containing protein n=1 Tax=Mytilus coruscus TaxID=42192 RepID=A0A6J8AX44_MYTCO|nr:unnamed protein product [Mytilus coruscus]